MSEGSDDPSFYTETIDGVEVAGVVFNPKDGGFYEFVDPDEHDNWQRVEDPRTGEVLTWSSRIEEMMGEILSGHVRATVPADEWVSFREEYVEADEAEYETWSDRWMEISHADSREEGGVVECDVCDSKFWAENPDFGELGPTCSECGHPTDDPKTV